MDKTSHLHFIFKTSRESCSVSLLLFTFFAFTLAGTFNIVIFLHTFFFFNQLRVRFSPRTLVEHISYGPPGSALAFIYILLSRSSPLDFLKKVHDTTDTLTPVASEKGLKCIIN